MSLSIRTVRVEERRRAPEYGRNSSPGRRFRDRRPDRSTRVRCPSAHRYRCADRARCLASIDPVACREIAVLVTNSAVLRRTANMQYLPVPSGWKATPCEWCFATSRPVRQDLATGTWDRPRGLSRSWYDRLRDHLHDCRCARSADHRTPRRGHRSASLPHDCTLTADLTGARPNGGQRVEVPERLASLLWVIGRVS